MKIYLNTLICLSLLSSMGCTTNNNPVRVKNSENKLIKIDTCVQLYEDISHEQIVNSYYSFDDSREQRFLYNPTEYVKLVSSCANTKNFIQLEDIHIDETYHSAGKLKSYLRFIFDIKAGIFIDGKYYRSKYYQTTTTTDIMGWSNDVSINDPLSQGFENILLDIEKDINKVMKAAD